MTTIIRSNVTLSSPRPGSQILPPIGLSGVTHRWHAESVPGSKGSTVTVIPDNVGNAPLNSVAVGTVKLGETASGTRYIDMGTPASGEVTRNRIDGSASGDSGEEWALVALVYWEPASSTNSYGIFGTNASSAIQGVSLEPSGTRIAAYRGNNTPTVWTEKTSKKGWHTVVTSYRKNGEESASLDGGPVAKGEIHAAGSEPFSVSVFSISGVPDNKIRVIDFAFVNHALSDAEHAAVHKALAAQIPQ